jgi:hypothetical protein
MATSLVTYLFICIGGFFLKQKLPKISVKQTIQCTDTRGNVIRLTAFKFAQTLHTEIR